VTFELVDFFAGKKCGKIYGGVTVFR